MTFGQQRLVGQQNNFQKKMAKTYWTIWTIGSLVLIAFFFWLTCFTMISPGYVAVVVDLFGDSKGVQPKELHVGAHWIAPWKKIYEFPVFEQNITWSGMDGFNFQTKDGMAIHGDIGITFNLKPESVPIIFQKYRRGMDEIANLFVRNYLRDAINTQSSKLAIESLYGPGKEEFFRNVENQVRSELEPLGIHISRVYLIGRFGFPETVITALNSKIEATQRAQQRENELREAEAQAAKDVAAARGIAQSILLKAEAEANANKLVSSSLSKELLIYEAVKNWNGILPTTFAGDAAKWMINTK